MGTLALQGSHYNYFGGGFMFPFLDCFLDLIIGSSLYIVQPMIRFLLPLGVSIYASVVLIRFFK